MREGHFPDSKYQALMYRGPDEETLPALDPENPPAIFLVFRREFDSNCSQAGRTYPSSLWFPLFAAISHGAPRDCSWCDRFLHRM